MDNWKPLNLIPVMLFKSNNSSLSLVYTPKHTYFVIYCNIIIDTFITTFILVAQINQLFKVPSKK